MGVTGFVFKGDFTPHFKRLLARVFAKEIFRSIYGTFYFDFLSQNVEFLQSFTSYSLKCRAMFLIRWKVTGSNTRRRKYFIVRIKKSATLSKAGYVFQGRSRSKVDEALDSVRWELTSRWEKSGVRSTTGSSLNSAMELKVRDRGVEDRANATNYLAEARVILHPPHSKSSDKKCHGFAPVFWFIKKEN